MPHAPIDCPPTGNDDFDNADWSLVPNHQREGLFEYIRVGRPTGGFLFALLSNDLFDAVGRADRGSLGGMKATVSFLRWMPIGCYGSRDAVNKWMHDGGLVGRISAAEGAEQVTPRMRGSLREFEIAERVIDANGVITKDREGFTPRPADNEGDPDIVLDLRQPPGQQLTTRAERQLVAMVPEGTQVVMIDTIKRDS